MVYKSSLENEHQIVTYKVGNEIIEITNKKTKLSIFNNYSSTFFLKYKNYGFTVK